MSQYQALSNAMRCAESATISLNESVKRITIKKPKECYIVYCIIETFYSCDKRILSVFFKEEDAYSFRNECEQKQKDYIDNVVIVNPFEFNTFGKNNIKFEIEGPLEIK